MVRVSNLETSKNFKEKKKSPAKTDFPSINYARKEIKHGCVNKHSQ